MGVCQHAGEVYLFWYCTRQIASPDYKGRDRNNENI